MISKEEFVDYINTFKEMWDEQNRLSEVIKYFNIFESFPAFSSLCDKYIRMISQLMHQPLDTKDGNDIEYFIYETDCGRDFHVGDVEELDGSFPDFTTPEKLYDYLEENLQF